MKRIIIAAILAASSVSTFAGGVTAITTNEAGGQIQLSNITCATESGFIARAFTGHSPDIYGCYTFDKDTWTVSVHWLGNGGDYRTYDFSHFRMTAYGRQVNQESSSATNNAL
jgi:hypothetical protein